MVAKLVRERRDIVDLGKSVVATELQKIRLVDPSPSPVASPDPPLSLQPLDRPPSPLLHNSGARYEVWYHSELAAAAKLAATPVQAKTTDRVPRFQLRTEPRSFELDSTVYTPIHSGNYTEVIPTGSFTWMPRCGHSVAVDGSGNVVDLNPPRSVYFSTV